MGSRIENGILVTKQLELAREGGRYGGYEYVDCRGINIKIDKINYINRITDEELDQVEKPFLELTKKFSWEKSYEADMQLHSLLVNKSGNKRLKLFIDTLNGQIERFRRVASKDASRTTNTVTEHIEIIKYLREKDLKACEESLRNHLNKVMLATLETSKIYIV